MRSYQENRIYSFTVVTLLSCSLKEEIFILSPRGKKSSVYVFAEPRDSSIVSLDYMQHARHAPVHVVRSHAKFEFDRAGNYRNNATSRFKQLKPDCCGL